MTASIGVDIVNVSDMDSLVRSRGRCDCIARLFTPAETAGALSRARPAERLALCFALKEAFFKATSSALDGFDFDLREVETVFEKDRPRVRIPKQAFRILESKGYNYLDVSTTIEGNLAIAFVLVFQEDTGNQTGPSAQLFSGGDFDPFVSI